MRRNTRFVSDSLHFTGIDLGDRKSGTYRRRQYSDSEDEDGDSDSSESYGEEEEEDEEEEEEDDDDDDDGSSRYLARLTSEEREVVLVRSALQLIGRAQAMGETDVHLNKQELEAYGRYLKRVKEEEEERARQRKKRNSGSGSDKKKAKEQRMAVPLTQLAPTSRKKKSSLSSSAEFPPRQDSLPRQRAANDLPPDGRDQQGYPPMGYFPPPSASRSRPRAGTTTSQGPSSRAREEYDYVSRPSSANRPRSSRGSPRDEASATSSRPHNNTLNPFQFQTAGPRVPYLPGAAAASRRHVSGPPEIVYEQRRGTTTPAAARSRHGSRRASYDEYTSEEGSPTSEESTSDDGGNGAQIRDPGGRTRGRGRSEAIIVEESPERTKSKKKSSSSPVKRKQMAGKKKKK